MAMTTESTPLISLLLSLKYNVALYVIKLWPCSLEHLVLFAPLCHIIC